MNEVAKRCSFACRTRDREREREREEDGFFTRCGGTAVVVNSRGKQGDPHLNKVHKSMATQVPIYHVIQMLIIIAFMFGWQKLAKGGFV